MTDPATASEELASLSAYVTSELLNIPIDKWGYFFPCHVAVWRYIHNVRPDLLGEVNAGYDSEPYFKGENAEWFSNVLGNDPAYLDSLELIMYPLISRLPGSARQRGFISASKLQPLSDIAISRLAEALSPYLGKG